MENEFLNENETPEEEEANETVEEAENIKEDIISEVEQETENTEKDYKGPVSEQKEAPKNDGAKYLFMVLLGIFVIFMSVFGSYLTTNLVLNSRESKGNGVVVYEGVETNQVTLVNTDLSPVVEKIQDTVVEVYTEQVSYSTFFGEYIQSGAGSGVIYSKDGLIVTNNHVIEGATSINVKLHDGTEYEAELVATDEETDLAVLKINASNLTPAILGSSGKLKVGETVIAIGNPLGTLGGTVTTGIVSGLSRTITIEKSKMTLLQTSCAISPGNSGGGLFNVSGELVAIVNAKSVSENVEGIGFAIPIDIARTVVEDLIKYGYVTGRPALGISGGEITSLAMANYYGYNHVGIYISELMTEQAKKSDLQPDDLIYAINGVEVDSLATLRYELYQYKAGDVVTLSVERAGQELEIKLTLSEKINN